MKFKSIFVISLLILSTAGVVFATAEDTEIRWPKTNYDKTIDGNSEEYQPIWDFGDITVCLEADEGSRGADDSCAIRNTGTWIESDTNVIDCKKVNGVDPTDNGFDYNSKLECRSKTPSSFTAGSDSVNTEVTITVMAGDKRTGYATKTFTITLTAPAALDSPPRGDSDSITVYTNNPVYSGKLTGYDINNDNYALAAGSKYYIANGPSTGTVTLDENTGDYTYTTTHTGTESTTDEFYFNVCDGPEDRPTTTCSETAAKISIDIEYVDVAPVWDETKDYTITLEEDNINTIPDDIDLDNYCSDAGALTFTESDTNSVIWTEINSYNNYVFFSLGSDLYGTQIMTVTCSDNLNSVQRDFTIIVNPVNDAPTVSGDSQLILFAPVSQTSSSTSFSHHAIDPDGDDLTVSPTLVSPPSEGSVDLNAMTYTYSTQLGEGITKQDSFKIKICDPSNECVDETFSVTITGSNRPPFADDVIFEANEDEFTEINLNAFGGADSDPSDVVSSARIISLGNSQIGGLYNAAGELIKNNHLVTANSPIYFLSAANKSSGNYKFKFDVRTNDEASSTEIYDFTVSIKSTEDAPVISDVGSVQMKEDGELMIMLSAQDADGDSLTISADADNLALFSELKIDKYNRLSLEPIEDQFGTAKVTLVVTDGKNYPVETTFDVIVNPRNDRPISDDAVFETFKSMSLKINSGGFKYKDIDSEDLGIKILSLPQLGTLTSATGSPVAKDSIYHLSDLNLDYLPIRGTMGEDSFKFLIMDDDGATTESYTATIDIIESPFGPNSQPAYFGGIPIPNFQYGDWSCKLGYQPVQNSVLNGYSCEALPNGVPVANFTIYPLFEDEAIKGQSIYFKSNSYDPDFDSLSFNWSFKENGTNLESIDNFDGSICNNGICSVTLSVSDEEDSNSIIKTFQYNSETDQSIIDELEDQISDLDNLEITEGKTYTDNELASLSLVKGSSTILNNKKITVDSQGKIIELKTLQSYTAPGDENYGNDANNLGYIVGDGKCNKFIGENSVNSPIDCEEKSNIFGIILVLSFISILGILGFVAWKKGLFTKLSKPKTSPSITSYEVPSYTQPTTQINTKPNLSSIVRTKINEGYSEGEIKSYLIAQGYSEADIDSALNS